MIIIVVTLITAGSFYLGKTSNKQNPQVSPSPPQSVCTQETKLCPDGSSVSRTAPNCEFAACPTMSVTKPIITQALLSPTPDPTTSWKTYINNKYKYSFRYPENIFYVEENEPQTCISKSGFPIAGCGVVKEKGDSVHVIDKNNKFYPLTIIVNYSSPPPTSSYPYSGCLDPNTNFITEEITIDGNKLFLLEDELPPPYPSIENNNEQIKFRVISNFTFKRLPDPRFNKESLCPSLGFVHKNYDIGIAGTYLPKNILPVIKQILSTFKFTEPLSYTVCGCGCCSGVQPADQCLYKLKGDSLDKIIEEDQKQKSSPQCALVGCSRGITYKYCD